MTTPYYDDGAVALHLGDSREVLPRLADGTAWPTVKPLALMRWLVRLVTPPGGLILDPFCGSGTTGEAAAIEGFRAVPIDQDLQAAELTKARLSKPIEPVLFGELS